MKGKKPLSNRSRRFPEYRFLVFALVLLTLFFLSTGISHAGDLKHAMNVNVEVSTGKYIKYQTSIPVTVDILNLDKDFSGRLELVYPQGYRSGKKESLYYRNISVPKNGKKRFFLYIPKTSYYTSGLIIRIKKGRDFKDYNVTYNTLQRNDKVVMVLNKDKGGFAYLSEYKTILPANTALNVVYPDQHKLPEAWKAYENIDCIVINNLPALNMDAARQKAILDYAAAGGVIIFSSNLDPNEFNNSIFKEYLPLAPEETVVLEADKEVLNKEETVIMKGEVQGETQVQLEDHPILIHKKFGEGHIFFVTADFSQKPFNSEYEEKEIWVRIFKAIDSSTSKTLRINDTSRILSQLPEMTTPPLDKIFWALLIYIVLIGPVNYFYLKKKDKLLYMFITIPIAALLFSTGIFFMGYATKGSSILLRKFNIVYMKNDQPVGFVDSAISLFSPGKAEYQLTLDDKEATGYELGPNYGDMQPTILREEENLVFEDMVIQMWSMRQLGMQKPQYFKEAFRMNVKENGKSFTGTIYNGTGLKLTGCVLFYKGNVSPTFDLNPGEKKIDIAIEKKGMLSPYSLGSHLTSKYNLQGDPDKKDPLKKARETAINEIANNMVKTGDRVILIGWNDKDISKITLNKKGAKKYNINIFYVR